MDKEYLKQLKEEVLKIEKAGEIEKIMEYKTAYARFKEKAIEKPDSIALRYFGNNITYRNLLTMIDNAAKGFYEIGIRYNDVVSMSMLGTPYGIVAFYALDKLGACMHMVNCASNLEEIKRELSNFNSKYFVANDIFCGEKAREVFKECGIEKIVTSSLTDSLPFGLNMDKVKYGIIEKAKGVKRNEYDGENLINFNQLLDKGRKSTFVINEPKYVPNKNVTIAYTSGSTGNSKACVATWEGIDSMVQIMAMTEEGRFQEGDIMFTTFPLWIYYSLLNMIHEPLCLGVSLAFDPLFSPKDVIKRNKQYKFNHWLTIPAYIKKMIEMNKNTDCSRWKIVLTGGDALHNEVKLGADEYIKRNNGTTSVAQGYGSSECLGSFAYGYIPNPTLGSVGVPCVGNMVKVLDVETKEELGPNQMGVGYLYTPTRMKEYYGDKEATDHNLIKDENGVIWYNSEDLIHVNEKNEIFLDGRIRRIVMTYDKNGNPTKIIPDRIKKSVIELETVSNCEVITLPDDEVINKAILFVVVKNKDQETNDMKNALIDYCVNNLPEYMVPKDVVFIDEIPLKPSKKPNFDELEKMYNELNKNTKDSQKNVKTKSISRK